MDWQVRGYVHRLDLGSGMTGRVVLAASESTGELVVIKYLRIDEEYLDQVRDEMYRLSALDASYFVRIREYVEEPDGTAIIMDPVSGGSLRLLLRDYGALSTEASLLLFRDSLAGLAGAHAAGVVHGDYRPENVIVATTGASLMLDVRMAAWIRRDITLGTGVYMAPERWRGEAISAAADVYAVTVTFVEMLLGEPPYWEESQLLALRYQHEQAAIPVEWIPIGLREVVRLGLAKDVDTRADAITLLGLLETAAVSEYGVGWELTGRRDLTERVALLSLPFGSAEIVEAGEFAAVGELAEMDDYYSAGTAATDAAVVAAAVEIVELAQMEQLAAAEALAAAQVEEETLTVDEELAVAEVEEIVAISEVEDVTVTGVSAEEAAVVAGGAAVVAGGVAGGVLAFEEVTDYDEVTYVEEDTYVEDDTYADEVAVGVVAVTGTAIAAGAAEIAEYQEVDEFVLVGAGGPPMATRPAAPTAVGLGAAGGAAAGGSIAIGYLAEERNKSFIRRHPWTTGFIAFILLIVCAGGAIAATGGLSSGPPSSTPVAAISPSSTSGVPGLPGGSSSPPGVTTSPSGSPVPSTSCSASSPVSLSPSPSHTPTHTPSPSPSPSSHPSTTPPSHSPSPSPTNPYLVDVNGHAVADVPPAAGVHLLASTPPGPC